MPHSPPQTAATVPDEFAGQGGSYIVDPKTGKRRRVEEATRAPDAVPPSPAPDTGAPDED